MILQKSGRTQWSCDGNGFSQPSICSTLGQELNQRQIFETGSSEASFYRTQDLPRGSPSKIEPRISQYGGNGGGTRQQPSNATMVVTWGRFAAARTTFVTRRHGYIGSRKTYVL
uniref:Uncharacterized protein n=1 Tax=Acrobeloides nanus TaxID=290746 RepID=A0A914BZS0_9BILA